MILSMTGFASAERLFEFGRMTWELRSVNHRYLEIGFRVPEEFRSLEPEIRRILGQHLSRGKVDATLRFVPVADAAGSNLVLNRELLGRLLELHADIAGACGEDQDADAMSLMRWNGVIEEQPQDPQPLRAAALELLAEAAAERADAAAAAASAICDEDVEINRRIGANGLALLRDLWSRKGGDALHVLTHCNAGWLATVDWGTALAPIYRAHDEGIPVHVWVDETRPRNQGASLTAWELSAHGVPHDLVVDNVGGHLMQHGLVDACIVGTDRTTATGDVCNKIGTYLKALAAQDNGVPFYVALPGPTIDWSIDDGLAGIPIEERDAAEVTRVWGRLDSGETAAVHITPGGVTARNYAFDVTPARLVTGLITERGVCEASPEGLLALYPDRRFE